MTLMFSMIAIAESRIIINNGFKAPRTPIVASLGLGLGVSYDPEIFKILPANSIYVLVETYLCWRVNCDFIKYILPGGTDRETFCSGITSAEEMD